LTVPAIWNDAGKAATRAAAIQAGFLRDENDNRLTLITEPEAAAMFCLKTGLLNLKIHDAVLIFDCGSGTVDLIAYEVEGESPFTVAECTAGSGDSCGSTALNRNFSNILRTKIRKMKLPGRVYAKCIIDFENRIKVDFRNNNQKWAVDVGIEAEFSEAGFEEGYMVFTNEEILQCFEPVVNRILELIRNQIIAIQAQNRTLQNILVIGGFGGCPTHRFSRCYSQGCCYCRYHRTSHHLPCCTETLSHGDPPAFQRRTPPRGLPCSIA
jgi:hypothetical protein